MKCPFCGKAEMVLAQDRMPIDGVTYESLRCPACKQGVLTGSQLGRLATEYRKLRRTKPSMFAQWGNSLAIRIPKEIVEEYKLKPGRQARITKEKGAIKIVPE